MYTDPQTIIVKQMKHASVLNTHTDLWTFSEKSSCSFSLRPPCITEIKNRTSGK